jgi:hypothetical protein
MAAFICVQFCRCRLAEVNKKSGWEQPPDLAMRPVARLWHDLSCLLSDRLKT